jgi:hypothetical protein
MTDEIRYTAQLKGSLKLSRTGEWWHEGRPFENQRLATLFHRSIVFDESLTSFVVRIGTQQAVFDVEDTALFVESIEVGPPHSRGVLNDGRTFQITRSPILVGAEHQLYLLVPRAGAGTVRDISDPQATRARFSRAAHQVLLESLQEDGSLLIDQQIISISRVLISR